MKLEGLHWFVSPYGSPRGRGTHRSPWDIETALSHPAEVAAGDTIWLLPGVYWLPGMLTSELRGTAGKPICVRALPEGGEAVLDFRDSREGVALHLRGGHSEYRGFVLRNSSGRRWSEISGGDGDPRGTGVFSEAGAGVRLTNLRVQDFGTSLFESQASGIEIYGCIFCNSYWDAPDRSHGPGLYIRNRPDWPRKRLEDNVIFQHGRQGLQGFGSTPFAGFDVVGNVVFQNGIGRNGFHRNLMFGSAAEGQWGNVFRQNLTYFSPGSSRWNSNLFGGVSGCRDLVVEGNVFAHPGRVALDVNLGENVAVTGNRLVGAVEYSRAEDGKEYQGEEFQKLFPENEYFSGVDAEPSGTWAYVRPNRYLPDAWEHRGRAWVVIFNWDRLPEAAVELTALEQGNGLARGSRLTIAPVQNPAQKWEVSYQGGEVAFPMTGWEAAAPAGRDLEANPLPAALPELGVFQVEWPVEGLEKGRREPEVMADPGAGLEQDAAWEARRLAWEEADEERREDQRGWRRLSWRHRRLQAER